MKEKKALQKGTMSQRFTDMIVKEFTSATNSEIQLTNYQKELARHLFIAIDNALQEAERRRADNTKPPIIWQNINLQKLAVDAVYRIQLGLDALIENSIHPIPYYNSRSKKYDLDLRIGYRGKDYYRRQMAINPPKDIIYELVHKTDIFKPIKKSANNPVEFYQFEITNPFNRGEVIGGFAYFVYDDSTKNKLIIVTRKDFEKSKALAKTKEFWTNWEETMMFKTLVNRATSKLLIDPEKVNEAFYAVEKEESIDIQDIQAEIEESANTGEIIDVEPLDMKPEEVKEIQKSEESQDKPQRMPGF